MNNTNDRNWGCRISDEHIFRGLRMLVLENDKLRISVLLDKGADIYEFQYKPRGVDFMWRSPNPLRDPRTFVPSGPRDGGAFADYYHGGWQEIFPTGGMQTDYMGTRMGQHGEVSLIPWNCRIIEDGPDQVAALLWTRTCRSPFLVERVMRLKADSSALFIEERIVNEGGEELPYMWGHHPAIGGPFLDETCRIDAPAKKVVVQSPLIDECSRLEAGAVFESFPIVKDRDGKDFDLSKIPSRNSGTAEMCYLTNLAAGWCAVTSRRLKTGFALSWDKDVFPVIWLWEVFGGLKGYPWYGNTYNIAMEPWTSWPGGLHNAEKNGMVPRIGAGCELRTTLTASAYEGLERVTDVLPDGTVKGSK